MKRGESWGGVLPDGTSPTEVHGDDRALAAAIRPGTDQVLRFRPAEASDFARALGIDGTAREGGARATVVSVDVLDAGDLGLVVNGLVMGTSPSRLRSWSRSAAVTLEVDGRPVFDGTATSIIIANGQFFAGCNVAPRGHPGDGVIEAQVYAVPPNQRRELGRRIRTGHHLPHPGIRQFRGREVRISTRRRLRLEVDGGSIGRRDTVVVSVVPAAVRLVVSDVEGSSP